MMKLNVVTKGEYSDYRIIAICSTSEKAEEAKKLFNASDVEEWELDNLPDHPPGHWPFAAYMDIDGNSEIEPTYCPINEEPAPYGDGKRMSFNVFAADE